MASSKRPVYKSDFVRHFLPLCVSIEICKLLCPLILHSIMFSEFSRSSLQEFSAKSYVLMNLLWRSAAIPNFPLQLAPPGCVSLDLTLTIRNFGGGAIYFSFLENIFWSKTDQLSVEILNFIFYEMLSKKVF